MKAAHSSQPVAVTPLLAAVLPHEQKLRALLWRYTRNHADTDELLQEIYLHLHTVPATEIIRAPLGYAITLARSLAIDWVRHMKVIPIELLADISQLNHDDPIKVLDRVVAAQEELEQLVAAVQQLAPKMRRIFVLAKVYGLTHTELAESLGISHNTIEQHLAEAVRQLAAILGNRVPKEYS